MGRMNALQCFIIPVLIFLNSNYSEGIQTTWQYTTACYGADPDCSEYKIECGTAERIVIGSLKYGGKSSPPRCQFGISDCDEPMSKGNTTRTVASECCTYDPNDYLTEFMPENRTTVVHNCNGKHQCLGSVPRLYQVVYSSYVWIQYTCINDDSTIQMCQTNRKSGLDLFVTFNISQGYTFPSLNGSRDCTCQLHTLDCSSSLELRVLDFNFTSTSSEDISPVCSNSYLELTPSQQIDCRSPVNLSSIIYRHNAWSDTVAVRHLFWNGTADRPGLVVVQVKAAHTRSPVVVECYPPGVEPPTTSQCTQTTNILPVTTGTSYPRTTTSYPSTANPKITHSPSSTTGMTSTRRQQMHKTNGRTVSASTFTMPATSTPTTQNVDSTQNDTVTDGSYTMNESTNDIGMTTSAVEWSTPYMTSISNLDTSTAPETSIINSSGQSSTNDTPLGRPGVPDVNDRTVTHVTTTEGIENGDSNALVIGLTVGVIVALLLLAALIAMCCYIRLKRKEKVQRHYVRNTNIFYSIPEEYTNTENALYEPADLEPGLTDNIFSTVPRKSSNSSTENPPSISRKHQLAKSFPLDDYARIKHVQSNGVNSEYPIQAYQSNVANGTVEFINGTEPEEAYFDDAHANKKTINLDDVDNHITTCDLVADNSVAVDPISMYSHIRKESKTKF